MKFSSLSFLFLLFIFALFQGEALGQVVTISGTVSDTSNKEIPYAQVIVQKAGTDDIFTFSQCDNKGNYTLRIDSIGLFVLTFRALSFTPKQDTVQITELDKAHLINLSVQLDNNPITFKEVIVQAERSISVSGDTITFKSSDFIQGDEEVIEDLLAKLPGFDVADDGTIRFAGKEIEKVLIEGSDIFGKGYNMITKTWIQPSLKTLKSYKNTRIHLNLRGLKTQTMLP